MITEPSTAKRASNPTGRAMWRLIRAFPWRYAANLVLWTIIWTMPIIPGLKILRRDGLHSLAHSLASRGRSRGRQGHRRRRHQRPDGFQGQGRLQVNALDLRPSVPAR